MASGPPGEPLQDTRTCDLIAVTQVTLGCEKLPEPYGDKACPLLRGLQSPPQMQTIMACPRNPRRRRPCAMRFLFPAPSCW